MNSRFGPLLLVVGPTASGKSGLAMELCRALGGEIISADSMQVYRGCDVVTAKPTAAEREEIPHHLIDVVNPDEKYSAGQWAEGAREAVREIRARGKTPVVCGGTGFYIKALLVPATLAAEAPDSAQREAVERETAGLSNEAVHSLLAEINPELAGRLHPNDRYRVARGLEISRSGGSAPVEAEWDFEPVCFGLEWERAELYRRIEQRVREMLAHGAMEELRELREKWGADCAALGGVGYKQLRPAMEEPASLGACIEEWQRDTRRYAKRQLTWFRHQLQVQWLPAELPNASLVAEVTKLWRARIEASREG